MNNNNYKCEKCGMLFTRSVSMLRHQRESCAKRLDNTSVGGKRRRIDGDASTSSIENCAVCDVSVPRGQMLAHSRTSQHKSKTRMPLSDGVQLIQHAFKNRIASYHINSEIEHVVDYSTFFADIETKVLQLISDILGREHALKINMVVVGRYFLQSQEIFSEKSFNTCNEVVTMGSDLKDVYESFVEAMKVQATEFQEKDSGMVK